MRKHAFLSANIVIKIAVISDSEYAEQIKKYTTILDIEDVNLDIQVGWIFTGESWSSSISAAPPVPLAVTPRQIRLALLSVGVTAEMLDNAISSFDEPLRSQAKIAWEYSTLFLRDNPLIKFVQTTLNWTDAQVDDLWRLANTI